MSETMAIDTKSVRARAKQALVIRESEIDPGGREGALADIVEDDVPALCEAVDKLRAVVDALPKCKERDCGKVATWELTIDYESALDLFCDAHQPGPAPSVDRPYDYNLDEVEYAAELRALGAQ